MEMYKVRDNYKFRKYPNRKLWIYGDDGEHMHYCTDGFREKLAKLKYKKRTRWSDIKYGMYFTAEFPDKGKKNIYLMDLLEYR